MFDSIDDLGAKLAATGYFIDPVMTQAVSLAAKLQKPLLLEGPAGSGNAVMHVRIINFGTNWWGRPRKTSLPGSSNSAKRTARRSTGSAALYELWKPESSIAGARLRGLLTELGPQPARWNGPRIWCSTTC